MSVENTNRREIINISNISNNKIPEVPEEISYKKFMQLEVPISLLP
jgi:hypothetical protein